MSRHPDDHSWEEEYIFNADKEIESLKVDLNIEKDINKFNRKLSGVLICLVISLALYAFTPITS